MTPDDAYWHACTGTPIDAEPKVARVAVDKARDLLVVQFEDGTHIDITWPEVVAAKRRPNGLHLLALTYYLSAKANSEASAGDPPGRP